MSLFKDIFKYKLLITALFVMSVFVAIFEGFGVSLAFPILQGIPGVMINNIPFPFNRISGIFVDMTLSQRLQSVAVLLFASTLIKGILVYISVILTSKLQVIVTKDTRMGCVRQLMSVGMNYFNKQRASDFQLIIDGYTNSTAGALVNLVGTALPQLFTVLLMVGILLCISWKLTIVAIFLVVVSFLFLNIFSKKMTTVANAVIITGFSFNKAVFDVINGMKLIRLFGKERKMTEEFEKSVGNFNDALFKVLNLTGIAGPVFEITGIAILAIILVTGSFFISGRDGTWLSLLLTFLVILTRLIAPVKSLSQTRATILSKMPALNELNKFLNTTDKKYVSEGNIVFGGLLDGIEFKDVTFSYNVKDRIVLKNVSFKVKKGMNLGVVGPSGSGKSTIAELLLRFYDPQHGHIILDGKDLQEYNVNSLRRHIGVVSQDTFLFNDTIRYNISFSNENASMDEVILAAKRANAHDFIMDLPNGYDTFVGDRGVLLSGGQKQRLAIARAILSEPEMLIFDEATSALDTESEQIVQKAMDEIGKGRTVITIAHRLSTVANSDNIIVIENGEISEQGRHDVLLKNDGLYRRLVNLQAL